MKKALVAIAILILIAPGAYAEKEFTFEKQNNFDGAAVKSILVEIPFGEISLVKSQNDNIDVRFNNAIMADDQAEADEINSDLDFRAELSGDELVISINTSRHEKRHRSLIGNIFDGDNNGDIYMALKVSLPAGKDIEISSASADIDVSDLELNLDIRSASSDIDLENTKGSFYSKIASGDINITGHQGTVTIKGVSSDLRLTDIKGDVDVRAISGDIVVEKTDGSVKASTVSGDIQLGALSAPEGIFDIESVSGEISMEVSGDFKGEIAVNSISGDVNSRLSGRVVLDDDRYDSSSRSRLRGTVGDGRGRLNVATTSGDITISGY